MCCCFFFSIFSHIPCFQLLVCYALLMGVGWERLPVSLSLRFYFCFFSWLLLMLKRNIFYINSEQKKETYFSDVSRLFLFRCSLVLSSRLREQQRLCRCLYGNIRIALYGVDSNMSQVRCGMREGCL